ncbi:FAM72 protein-domain-containing protein [Cladochytrium replicatum]|nr:FAM72 protein-domain-containing protein [Cladochytrium replicatum]
MRESVGIQPSPRSSGRPASTSSSSLRSSSVQVTTAFPPSRPARYFQTAQHDLQQQTSSPPSRITADNAIQQTLLQWLRPLPGVAPSSGSQPRAPDGAASAATSRPHQHHQRNQQQQQRITTAHTLHSHFRFKTVVKIFCSPCSSLLCTRGMIAVLLGNTQYQLFSTDMSPQGVQLVFDDHSTENCKCRIRSFACKVCGSIAGYHVTRACEDCLQGVNNGHFWMFHANCVNSSERHDSNGKVIRWSSLPPADRDEEELGLSEPGPFVCR